MFHKKRSFQCTMHQKLAAGLRPDPLGELKRFPRPPSRNMRPTSKGREGGKGKGREWERRVGKERGRVRHTNPNLLPVPLKLYGLDDDDERRTSSPMYSFDLTRHEVVDVD